MRFILIYIFFILVYYIINLQRNSFIMAENTYVILLCGAVIVIALHLLSNNKKTSQYLGKHSLHSKNPNGAYDKHNGQVKIDLQGNEKTCTSVDVGETNQVILHKYIFDKLQEIANDDYGVKNLTCPYEVQEYSRLTIPKNLLEQINNKIMFPILAKLNECTNMTFEVTTVFNVVKKIAKDNSVCMYLIELFIYDKINFFGKKLVIDVHYNLPYSHYHINSINYSTNDYLCNEIYKPRDTLGDASHNINSNLVVLETSKPCKEQDETLYTHGQQSSGLDYTTLNHLNNYNSYTDKSDAYNKIQLPNKIVEMNARGMKAWPCGKTENEWDEYGVLISNGSNTCATENDRCLGNYDSSYQGVPLDTYFHPSSYESRK